MPRAHPASTKSVICTNQQPYPSREQLMELAGLACTQSLAMVYDSEKYLHVLVCWGPGNQTNGAIGCWRPLDW